MISTTTKKLFVGYQVKQSWDRNHRINESHKQKVSSYFGAGAVIDVLTPTCQKTFEKRNHDQWSDSTSHGYYFFVQKLKLMCQFSSFVPKNQLLLSSEVKLFRHNLGKVFSGNAQKLNVGGKFIKKELFQLFVKGKIVVQSERGKVRERES